MKFWRYAVIVVSVLLSACSSLSPVSKDHVLVSASDVLQRNGRFAVLVVDKTQDKNSDSVQGNFSWVSKGQHVLLDLSSPLGQILARVEVTASGTRLTRSNGDVLEAWSPDELIEEVLGRQFPVSGLRYWIRGQAMPNFPLEQAKYDGQQRLTQFQQAGWRVTLQEYDAHGPKRFHLLNNQTTDRVTIRIVINDD